MIEDYIYKFKDSYRKIPASLKFPFGKLYSKLPLSLRYGSMYKEYRELLEKSQWWDRNKLKEWQMEQLLKLLKHAYSNIPYYRDIFQKLDLKPEHIKSFEDLRKLPYLTKEKIRENTEGFIAENYSKTKRIKVNTGGSSGTPLGFYWERGRTRALEKAFMHRQWNWVGYHPENNDKAVVLRGIITKNEIADYDPAENSLILSSFNLKKEKLSKYVEEIKNFQPVAIHGYPSVIQIIANFIARNKIEPIKSLKVILCASEKLLHYQRKLMEDAFKCRVFSWYGQTECVCLAGNCEISNDYHIFTEYGITEIIDANGNPISEDEEGTGEIVTTGFNNFLMPFIRYKTGDIGVRKIKKCNCGRNYPLLKTIEGRSNDYILTNDEKIISLTGLIFGLHFLAFEKINKMQMIQEEKGKIIIKIVKNEDYTRKDEKEINAKIEKATNGGLDLKFIYVDDIKCTSRGKHKFLIQKLPIKFSDFLRENKK